MWPISKRENDIRYRIGKHEEDLHPDKLFTYSPGPTETDLDQYLNNIHTRERWSNKFAHTMADKIRSLNFDRIAMLTGAGLANYAHTKYPAMLAAILPPLPEIANYAIFTVAGAYVGRYIKDGIDYGINKATQGYRWTKNTYEIKF